MLVLDCHSFANLGLVFNISTLHWSNFCSPTKVYKGICCNMVQIIIGGYVLQVLVGSLGLESKVITSSICQRIVQSERILLRPRRCLRISVTFVDVLYSGSTTCGSIVLEKLRSGKDGGLPTSQPLHLLVSLWQWDPSHYSNFCNSLQITHLYFLHLTRSQIILGDNFN